MKNTDGLVRVGGVGTGRIFQWAHLKPYLRLMDRARLVAFHDADAARAVQARDKYEKALREFAESHPHWASACEDNIRELRAHDSLDGVLEQVDAIDICTTTRGRMESAIAACEAGVHSMGEKPMARTWIIADRAARAFAARKDIYFQLNDDNVFDPRYLMLRDLVQGGAIGAPQSVWIIRGSRLNSTSVLKSQASALSNGGGCLMDYGSHGLAGVWSVLGTEWRFKSVEAVSIEVLHRHRIIEGDPYIMEVEDNARFKLLMENTRTGGWLNVFMEASWCGGHIGYKDMRTGAGGGGFLRIEGDEGAIEACERDRIVVKGWDGGETVHPLLEFEGETISFNNEIETFIDCVLAGTPPEIDVSFGAEIIAVCGAAYLSAKEGRAVTLDEFRGYGRGFVEKHGDTEEAELAVLDDLLGRYRYEGGKV